MGQGWRCRRTEPQPRMQNCVPLGHNKILFKASNLKPPVQKKNPELQLRPFGVAVPEACNAPWNSTPRGGFTNNCHNKTQHSNSSLAHCYSTLKACMLFFAHNHSNNRFRCRHKTRESLDCLIESGLSLLFADLCPDFAALVPPPPPPNALLPPAPPLLFVCSLRPLFKLCTYPSNVTFALPVVTAPFLAATAVI